MTGRLNKAGYGGRVASRAALGGPRYVYTLDLTRSVGYWKEISEGAAGPPAEEVGPAP
ncbi:MAG: hypothetical protein LUO79_06670 [Methanomassiliicoccales archaeon]|nr:hypothetical protein [Methanomassiliicoccales archaeon]